MATAPIESFLYEETIEPDQIGACKVDVPGRFVRQWVERGLDFEHAGWVREECIGALSEAA